jgi:hypothetical protein
MIKEDRVEKALTFLRKTDELCAKAKALMKGLDDQKKTIHAIQYLKSTGAQGEKDKIALASDEYAAHLDKVKSSIYEYEELKNRRDTEILVIETWRSMNANQRRGNI